MIKARSLSRTILEVAYVPLVAVAALFIDGHAWRQALRNPLRRHDLPPVKHSIVEYQLSDPGEIARCHAQPGGSDWFAVTRTILGSDPDLTVVQPFDRSNTQGIE